MAGSILREADKTTKVKSTPSNAHARVHISAKYDLRRRIGHCAFRNINVRPNYLIARYNGSSYMTYPKRTAWCAIPLIHFQLERLSPSNKRAYNQIDETEVGSREPALGSSAAHTCP